MSHSGYKIAVIDLGCNSLVLLVATCMPDGSIEYHNEHYALTKLGRDVKKSGKLSDAAVDRSLAALAELMDIAREDCVDDIIITASSAVRMAENSNRFLVKCYKQTGIFPQVLSGREEAEFTFRGAISEIETIRPIVTIDIGGGSTEISWGMKDLIVAGHSLDLGCVNLNEAYNLGEEYVLYKRITAVRHVRREWSHIADDLNNWIDGRKCTVVATGGTATTYAAIASRQAMYDRRKIQSVKGRRKELAMISRRLARMDLMERRCVPGIDVDRVVEIPAGLLILTEFLKYFQFKKFTISPNGLRYGILTHYAELQ
jgi:exopolyphosphatase/guanosine-5'-triphosphate,3'-diphosphate pyrophosphatase